MAHQYHSCQGKQPFGAYPVVEGHGVQQDFLRTERLINELKSSLTLDNPRDNAPQSFAYRIIIN